MTANSSLLQWLATFQLDGRPSIGFNENAYYNLADGYVCARILNQISSSHFPDTWLDGIKPVPPNGSWRLRVSNLKRILQKIHDFASDIQNPQFTPESISPDVAVIAQNFDPDQINKLLQLILFCAINSVKRQIYIEKIQDLPTRVKQDIKDSIEELFIQDVDTQGDNSSQAKPSSRCEDNLSKISLKKQPLNPEVYSTNRPLGSQFIDHNEIGTSNKENKLEKSSSNDNNDNSLLWQQNKKLISEVHQLKEELINVETEREDFRLKSDLLKDDLDKISRKHDELKSRAELSQKLQDELDELRHVVGKSAAHEMILENLEKKNIDLRSELKVLEEKNLIQSERIAALQEENSQLASNVSRVDIYKKKLQEVQTKLSHETHRAEKAEVELNILSEKYCTTKKENEKLYETSNRLMMLNGSNADNTSPSLIGRVEELQRQLFQREQELADSEAKYQKSLKKAKELMKHINQSPQTVGGSLHPSCISSVSSFNSNSLEETNILKQQLRDREERVVELEREFYEFKKMKEIHERLMMSAFYELTTPMQWKNAEKRLERRMGCSNSAVSPSISNEKHSH